MRLTADRAPLCYPSYLLDNPTPTSESNIAPTEDCVMSGDGEGDETLPACSEVRSEVVPSADTDAVLTAQEDDSFTHTASVGPVSLGDSIAAAEESSHNSVMTSREVTRLLMLLFDASENDDVGSSPGNDDYLTNDEQSSHTSRAITGSGRGSARGKLLCCLS